jgi:hypothetical protein
VAVSIARWYAFTELFAFCDLHASRVRGSVYERLLDPAIVGPGPRYYDRQGFPIPAILEDEPGGRGWIMPTLVWAQMREQPDYPIVAVDELPDGSRLSTVWLGLDHGYGGRPLIFETMRFSAESEELMLVGPGGVERMAAYSPSIEFPDPFGEPGDLTEQLRYSTEEEALAAHHEIVRRLRIREGH